MWTQCLLENLSWQLNKAAYFQLLCMKRSLAGPNNKSWLNRHKRKCVKCAQLLISGLSSGIVHLFLLTALRLSEPSELCLCKILQTTLNDILQAKLILTVFFTLRLVNVKLGFKLPDHINAFYQITFNMTSNAVKK